MIKLKEDVTMKKIFISFLLLLPFLQSCVQNAQTGEMEPGWFFWVFLGLLVGILFLGALISFFRKKKSDDAPTKSEQEIQAYEETLEKKLEEEDKKEK